MMELTEEIRASHRDHSATAVEFLELLLEAAGTARKLSWESVDLPSWIQDEYPYALQRLPTLIDEQKLQEVERATVSVWQLVRGIPEKIFHNDARRFSDFFGLNNEALAFLLLEPPNGLHTGFCRCDLIDTLDGFKCLELNLGTNVGGWQIRFWERTVRSNSTLAEFLRARKLKPFYRDPLKCIYEHVIKTTLAAGRSRRGRLNTAIVVDAGMRHLDEITVLFNQVYTQVLAQIDPSLGGEVLLCTYPSGLTVRGSSVDVAGREIDAIIEYGKDENTPQEIYRCFKSEEVMLFGGPLLAVLDTKRNLALLSEAEESPDFTAEEREAIRKYIPWSRVVRPGTTRYRGEKVSMMDLLAARREDFVLKPATGSSGKGILVGRLTSQAEWEAALRNSAATPEGWLVQEHVSSRSYLYLTQDGRYAPHDMVWGTFSVGDTFGGGFLRMMAQEIGSGIINSATGASEGMIIELSRIL